MLPEYFANRTENPSNGCFDGGREWPSGVFNVSACRFKAPVFLSQPHFYQGTAERQCWPCTIKSNVKMIFF